MSPQALRDLKVVEWSEFVSGPYCGKFLADLGAEVIKVEKPGCGDPSRSYGPFPGDIPHYEKSGLFLYLNSNKLGITLNVGCAAGAQIFRQLVQQADVLLENHRPSEVEELGLTYDNLRELNPGLVMTSISPFGQTGPLRDYRTCNLVSTHMSGLAFINPSEGVDDAEGKPPLKTPGHQGDMMAGLTAAVATMSALLARQMSGKGQHVDVSEHEALASIMRRELAVHAMEGMTWTRPKGTMPHQTSDIYRCSDGAVYLACSGDRQWGPWVEIMGNPEWAMSELFQDQTSRRENWDAAKTLVEDWTSQQTVQDVLRAAESVRAPCRQVNTPGALVESEVLAAREFFEEVDHPEAGRVKQPGAPYKLSESPWKIRRPAPRIGEHNEDIYCGRLGYSKEDLARMRAQGVA